MSANDLRNLNIMKVVKRIESYNKNIKDTFYIRLSKQLRNVHMVVTSQIIKILRDRSYISDPNDIYDIMIKLNKIEQMIKCENPITREFDTSIKKDVNKIYNALRTCGLMRSYEDIITYNNI